MAGPRAFTAEERKNLRAALRHDTFSWKARLVATGGVFLVAAFVAGVFLSRAFDLDRLGQWTAVFGLVAAWVIFSVPYFRRMRVRFGTEALRQDLAAGVASVERYEITDAIEMQEYEDLGTAFFLQQSNGSPLFLIGQYLDDLVEEGRFPCAVFEIVRAPRSRVVLGLVCVGDTVKPSRVIGPFRRQVVREGKIPPDGSILPLAWASIPETYS